MAVPSGVLRVPAVQGLKACCSRDNSCGYDGFFQMHVTIIGGGIAGLATIKQMMAVIVDPYMRGE